MDPFFNEYFLISYQEHGRAANEKIPHGEISNYNMTPSTGGVSRYLADPQFRRADESFGHLEELHKIL